MSPLHLANGTFKESFSIGWYRVSVDSHTPSIGIGRLKQKLDIHVSLTDRNICVCKQPCSLTQVYTFYLSSTSLKFKVLKCSKGHAAPDCPTPVHSTTKHPEKQSTQSAGGEEMILLVSHHHHHDNPQWAFLPPSSHPLDFYWGNL